MSVGPGSAPLLADEVEALALIAPPTASPGPSILSHSRIETWNTCGEKFRLTYIENAPRQAQGSLIGGKAIHTTIEHAEQATLRDLRQLTSMFRATFDEEMQFAGGPEKVRWGGRKSKDYPQGENWKWWNDKGEVMLGHYLDTRTEDESQGLVLKSSEEHVLATLKSGQAFQGYLDAFLVSSDGEPRIRDYKSGQPGRSNGIQLALYAWAWHQITGTTVEQGEFIYLRTADPEKRRELVDLRPLIPIAQDMAEGAQRGIAAEIYVMKPDKSFCKACTVRKSCSYGVTLEEE